MHLQDVLGMWYRFTYSPSSKVAPQMNAHLSSFALKICEGTSTLPSESFLCATLIAFLKKLTMAQPPDPALCDLLNDSLFNEYLRSLFTIQRQAGHYIAVDGTKTTKTFYLITSQAVTNPPFIISLMTCCWFSTSSVPGLAPNPLTSQ